MSTLARRRSRGARQWRRPQAGSALSGGTRARESRYVTRCPAGAGRRGWIRTWRASNGALGCDRLAAGCRLGTAAGHGRCASPDPALPAGGGDAASSAGGGRSLVLRRRLGLLGRWDHRLPLVAVVGLLAYGVGDGVGPRQPRVADSRVPAAARRDHRAWRREAVRRGHGTCPCGHLVFRLRRCPPRQPKRA